MWLAGGGSVLWLINDETPDREASLEFSPSWFFFAPTSNSLMFFDEALEADMEEHESDMSEDLLLRSVWLDPLARFSK